MIPKVIHYCWFGGAKKSKLIKKCMKSWEKFCPDYEIKEWNEINFDLHCCKYVEEAVNAKKWAFVADYFRFWVIVNNGGIYFDTDIRVYKNFDLFLNNDFFCGYESGGLLEPAIIGGEKNNAVAETFLQTFETKGFNVGENFDLTPLPINFTEHFKKTFDFEFNPEKTEIKDNIAVYKEIVFRPKRSNRNKPIICDETAAMHCYSASWVDKKSKRRGKIYRFLCRVFGIKFAEKVRRRVGKNKDDK